jgi:hypothetical protein
MDARLTLAGRIVIDRKRCLHGKTGNSGIAAINDYPSANRESRSELRGR